MIEEEGGWGNSGNRDHEYEEIKDNGFGEVKESIYGDNGIRAGRHKSDREVEIGGSGGLKVAMANVRDLLSGTKLEELTMLCEEERLDIIAVTESWSTSAIGDSELRIEGYTLFRKDREREVDQKGGGVLLYVNENLIARELLEWRRKKCEAVWVEIKGGNGMVICLGVCYRSPNASGEENELLLNTINSVAEKRVLLLMGDFNYPKIDWDLYDTSGEGREFLDVVQDNFLWQHVEQATRGGNILDLVMSTERNLVDNVRITSPIGGSDHATVNFELCVEIQNRIECNLGYDYRRADYRKILEELGNKDWNEVFKHKSADEMWRMLVGILNDMKEKYVPRFKGRGRRKPKWMDYGACRALKKKYHAWKRYTEAPSYQGYVKFKRDRNLAVGELRRSKRKFEEKIAENIRKDSKTFYRYVRSKVGLRERIGPLLDEQGNSIDDDGAMGETLNRFFSSVFTRKDIKDQMNVINQGVNDDRDGKGDCGVWITEKLILEHIGKLKDNKAAGPDELGSTFVKRLADSLVLPLMMLFRETMATGEVPTQWKEANVAAIFKKGKKCEPGNYRPVSLTSQIGKIFERLIRGKIVEFLEGNDKLRDSQHGFRAKRSCLTNLLEFFEVVADYVDQGVPVDAVYLDFQKAFDKVSHDKLIVKLRRVGVEEGIVRWIGNWLKERRQRVLINGVASGWERVESGVPQGSVLGPVLFIIFIDDIDENVGSKLLKFADDTKLVARVGNEQDVERLREDLRVLFQWAEDWQMMFNVNKCSVIHFGFNNEGVELELGGRALEAHESEKDLGVMVQKNLKVDMQCCKAANEANRKLGMIRRGFRNKSRAVMLPLYKSMVRPHMDYCVQAWRPHLKKDLEKLEKVQRRATKMVEGLREYSYMDRLRILGLTTLETRFIRADLIEVYKIFRGLDRLDSRKFFILDRGVTRGHSFKLGKRRVRLDVGKFRFANRVHDEWNGLTEEVVSAGSLNVFKARLDHHMRNVRGFV